MDQEGELDSINVFQIHGGDGDGAEVIFDLNGQHIAVSVFPSSSGHGQGQCSIQDCLVHTLSRVSSGDVGEIEYDELLGDALEVVLHAGRPMFRAHATSYMELDSPRDLHSVIYPKTLHFQFVETCGKSDIIPIAPNEAYTLPLDEIGHDDAEEDELGIDTALPCYSTRAILLEEKFVQGSGNSASRVLVEGTEMFCKAIGNTGGLLGTRIGRELACLQQAHRLRLLEHDTAIRIPYLLGYVQHADTDRIIGFPRQRIPGRRLRDMSVLEIPAQRRSKWARQICEAVHALHARAIVWGDGKPGNVVIDEQDDAWLIESGGGSTKGWVDTDLAGTVEGDEQAIMKIEAFLSIGREGLTSS